MRREELPNALILDKININNINGIEEIEIQFDDRVSVICGDNGVGKTTILECIISSFNVSNSHSLRRNAKSISDGESTAYYRKIGKQEQHTINIDKFLPDQSPMIVGSHQQAKNVIAIRTKRDLEYSKLSSISRDPEINDQAFFNRLSIGLDAKEIKSWFANRFLFRGFSENWPNSRTRNLELAISLFGVMSEDVSFKTVDTSTFDIILNSPSGDVVFETMSSGYRSVFIMLIGIIKEIEYRGFEQAADAFSGVILIDEIELHLHPEWQKKILRIISEVFSSAQLIVTTHSPHVIQSSKAGEVIALCRSDEGKVRRRSLPFASEYGFVGWSLEEILTDVMGVQSTQARELDDMFDNFSHAIAENDQKIAQKTYEQLDAMLHPSSPYRKILKLNAVEIGGLNDKV